MQNFLDEKSINWIQDKIWLIGMSILILIIGWWFINRFSKILIIFFQKSKTDAGVVSFLNSLLKLTLRSILIIIILGTLGVNITSILTAVGAAFVALGLAFKDNLSNIISGIILIINKPIHIGDHIKCGASEGTVTKIEIMFTTLQSENEDKVVIVPNSLIITNAVTRSSDYNHLNISQKFSFEIPEKISEKQIVRFFETDLLLNQYILRIPQPEFKFEKIKDKKINFEISVWCEKNNSYKTEKALEKSFLKLKNKFSIEIL